MPPLTYHAGQLAIQAEAKTTHVAERLAQWIGPVADFAREADLLLFALVNDEGSLNFSALSGHAPLVELVDEPSAGLRHQADAASRESDLRLRFNNELAPRVATPTQCGGLAINFANSRRARINGTLSPTAQGSELVSAETFTLCRKYIAPSQALDDTPIYGPQSVAKVALDDTWLEQLVAQAETMFLASISPTGTPDVAHRGGPTGFLRFNPTTSTLAWEEFVGDGVFKSAGNIRATPTITVLIPDMANGDAVELIGTADYRNMRSGRQQRSSPLEQHSEDFPVQGVMTCKIHRALRLNRLMAPRIPITRERKITSCATVDVQAPQ